MRVCYCPLNCSPCSLKLEDVRHVSCGPSSVSVVLEKKSLDEKVVEFEKSKRLDEKENGKVDVAIKSSLKKPVAGCGEKGVKKGRVKWMDFVGKELVEIREFESL